MTDEYGEDSLGPAGLQRIRVGAPLDFPLASNGRCHDCHREPGRLHIPGCDAERCPVCGGQLISCDCWDDDDEDGP